MPSASSTNQVVFVKFLDQAADLELLVSGSSSEAELTARVSTNDFSISIDALDGSCFCFPYFLSVQQGGALGLKLRLA
jgi:hypothetical protein